MNGKPKFQTRPLLRRLTAVVLLVACCGCPPVPPSQEQQRQAATSSWITVECSGRNQEGDPCLNQDDLNMITSTVPTISTVVVEQVRTGKITFQDAEIDAMVSGTRPEYIGLLEVGARVRVQRGRFLESVEAEEGADVVVISNELATKLFPNAEPIGKSVVLEGRSLTVVGVVTDGAQWGSDVKRDAYVPLKLFGAAAAQKAPFLYDRFRFRVESLDQVKSTQSIIKKIIEQRHPAQNIRVRSFLSDNR